jgi:DNA helicase-2/ATP-dependent DNA helicase PcrA
MELGRICFDLYAPYVGDILHDSERIRQLVAAMYPVVTLDEFQDTNEGQWRVVRALGEACRLIALADPEQRIYGWLGADPARLDHFPEAFRPTEVDQARQNLRVSVTRGKRQTTILTPKGDPCVLLV